MKLLILLSRIPYPLEKGDKLRAFNQIRYLSEKHEIILCALSDTQIDPKAYQILEKYCSSVNFFRLHKPGILFNTLRAFLKGKPFQTGYFYNRRIKKKILRLIKEHEPDHVFCQLIRTAEYVADINISKTIDYQDAFSKGIERRMTEVPFFIRPVFRMEYKRLVSYERDIFDKFDNSLIISQADRDCIQHHGKNKIIIVPNGVDHEFFKPMVREKKYDLLFTGNMSYPPNISSVEYIINKILPLLLKNNPGIRLLIAGASPARHVRKYNSSNVVVTGWVDDIRECYAESRIFLAPMQIGTGMQNKILEAMSMKLPCITSRLANNAINAKEGEEILIGNTPEEYSDCIIRLLHDQAFYRSISENAFSFVHRSFSWQESVSIIDRMISNKT